LAAAEIMTSAPHYLDWLSMV